MRFMVDDDLLLADVGKREPLLPQSDLERDPACQHVFGNHRVTGLYRKSFAQLRGLGPGRLQPRQLDRLELILHPRLGREHDL